MRPFALVAMLVLAGCTAPQTVVVESTNVAATPSDDPRANCDLPEDVQKQIELHYMAIEALNARSRFEQDRHLDVIEIRKHLDALIQRALNECAQKGRSLAGHVFLIPGYRHVEFR